MATSAGAVNEEAVRAAAALGTAMMAKLAGMAATVVARVARATGLAVDSMVVGKREGAAMEADAQVEVMSEREGVKAAAVRVAAARAAEMEAGAEARH